MSTEEKFLAAVNVINSLPEDGPFQPSDDLSLKFQAYYKQATEGPCNSPKPSFFDRNKHEWHAWKSLEDMPKEVAMEKYVEQLSKVIETMSYTDSVSKFIDLMGPFYEIVWPEDVSAESGEDFQRQESSDLQCHDKEDKHSVEEAAVPRLDNDNIQESFEIISHQSLTRETVSLQRFEVSYHKETVVPVQNIPSESPDSIDSSTSSSSQDEKGISLPKYAISTREILPLMLNLQQSLESILSHLEKLETVTRAQIMEKRKVESDVARRKKRTFTPLTMLLVMLWPFIVHWVVYIFRKRRKTTPS